MTPARAIDAAYFPHIVDNIFDNAPLKSLAIMRLACRSWEGRCTRQIGYHLIVEEAEHVTVRPGLASEGTFIFRPTDFVQCLKEQWSYEYWTKVLDIIGPEIPRTVCALLNAWGRDSVETMRFSMLMSMGSWELTKHLSVYRVVNFDFPDWPDAALELNDFSARKVVMHLVRPSKAVEFFHSSRARSRDAHTTLQEVVIILRPWTVHQPDQEGTGAATVEKALDENFGHLLGLVEACRRWLYHATIVGLEHLTHASLGLKTDDELQGKSVEETVMDYIKICFPPHSFDSDISDRRYTLTFMRMEQYRKAVGDVEFHIDVEDKLLVHPSRNEDAWEVW